MLHRHLNLIGPKLNRIQADLDDACRPMRVCVALVWMTAGLMLGILLGLAC